MACPKISKSMSRDSIVFFRTFMEVLENLPPEQYKEVCSMLLRYAFDDIEPTEGTNPLVLALFTSFKAQIDYNINRYEIYMENGKRGGAPKGSRNNPNGRRGKKGIDNSDSDKETIRTNGTNQELTETNQELTGTNSGELVNSETNELTELSKTNLYVYGIDNVIDNNVDVDTCTRESENKKFLEEFFKEEKRAQIEVLCMQLSTTPEVLRKEADEVIAEWELAETTHESYNEQAKHLINQIRIKHRKQNSNGTTKTASAARGLNEVSADTKPKTRTSTL